MSKNHLQECLEDKPQGAELFRFKELCPIPKTLDFIAAGHDGRLARFSIEDFDREKPMALVKTEYASLYSLSMSPEGNEFLIIPGESNFAELRNCTDLSLIEKIYFDEAGYPSIIAFSPNGRWLAAAGNGKVYLIERNGKKVVSSFNGGERIYSLCFDSTSSRLASVHSFQGGAYLQVDEVTRNGELNELGQIPHSLTSTKPEDFVDTLVDVHFSDDDRYLVLFETSAIYEEYKSPGWRGNLVAFDLLKAQVAWIAPINKFLTFDDRSLSEAGFGMGFFTKILVHKNAVYCGATLGKIIVFNLADGFPLGRYELPVKKEAVTFLALNKQNHSIMAISENGDFTVIELE